MTDTLPVDTAVFTDREAELRRITRVALEPGAGLGGVAIVAIDGMPAVGKTTLAVHAAHTLAKDFPDRRLFVDLLGYSPGVQPVTVTDALAALLTSDGVDPRHLPASQSGRSALWRDRMAGKKVLLVLDNAARADQVVDLIPGTGRCLVLVTGRPRMDLLRVRHGATILALDILPEAEALKLFARLAGRPLTGPDEAAARELIGLCGRLPLAVALLAARLQPEPWATVPDLLRAFRETHDRVSAIDTHAPSAETGVAAAFDLSYRSLSDRLRRVLRQLSLHPGTEVDPHATAALTGLPLDDAAEALDRLYTVRLLDQPAQGRYRMHDLIHEFGQRLAADDPTGEQEDALARLLDFYQHTAAIAGGYVERVPRHRPRPVRHFPTAVPDIPDAEHAVAWLRAENAGLRTCIDDAAARHDYQQVVALTAAIAPALRMWGPWDTAARYHKAAAAAARDLRDTLGEGTALNHLGIIQRLVGDFLGSTVTLEQARTQAVASGDLLGEANAVHLLGSVLQATARYPEAQRAQEHALALYHAVGSPLGEANALSELAAVRYLLDDYQGSVEALDKALPLYRSLNNQVGEAAALNYLGAARRLLGDYPGASQALERAMLLWHTLGDRTGEADALSLLGNVHRFGSDFVGAAQAFEGALEVFQVVGDLRGQANSLGLLGDVRGSIGRHPEAVQALDSALALCRALGSRLGEANSLNYLGLVRNAQHDHTAAIDALEQALAIYRDIGGRLGEANALRDLGLVRHTTGALTSAAESLGQALTIYRDIGDQLGEATALNRLSMLRRDLGEVDQASTGHHRALQLARARRNPLEEARALEGLGMCALRNGDVAVARQRLRESLSILRRTGAADQTRVAASLDQLR